MSSTWGEHLKLSIFGESHGTGIGVVLDGLPAGEPLDYDRIAEQMARRAPGRNRMSTARKEPDIPQILSGVYKNATSGAPLCAVIRNSDTHSQDYEKIAQIPRPGHADFTGFVRYGGHNDPRGGGHFSGRLTAPMVFAGAVCRQILERRGIALGAHLASVFDVCDAPFDPCGGTPLLDAFSALAGQDFPALDENAALHMRDAIEQARLAGDSVGGVVECAAQGLPAGLGDPIFGGVENRLSALLFGIPAVKGIEFGEGFHAASLHGSENNDPFYMEKGRVKTRANRHGGILGGITSGMPLLFRVAFKPTPSIFKAQSSVRLGTGEAAELLIQGRHDPCVAVRAVPVVEALTAVCILDLVLGAKSYDIG